ncbi:MAG: HD domain-containing protein [Arthrobacter sp.]
MTSTLVARAALAAVTASEGTSVANHSIRSFLFADILAKHEGVLDDAVYDQNLLFSACVMHDLGTGTKAPSEQRFEVEGADLAAEVLIQHRVTAADVDRVWEAIALHNSRGIAERWGLLAYLTRAGIRIDFGDRTDVVMSQAQRIHAEYPRLGMAESLAD